MTTCDACSVNIDGYDTDGTSVTPVGVTVNLCDLHAAAEDMLTELKLAALERTRFIKAFGGDSRASSAVEQARIALKGYEEVIARAEGRRG